MARRGLTFHVGAWCNHCGAQHACPARAGLVRTAAAGDLAALARFKEVSVDDIALALEEQVRALTNEEGGELFDRITLIRKMAEAGDKVLRSLARTLPDGLPLPGGRVLREVPWTAWAQSDAAKQELAAKKAGLKARGEIARVATTQVRIVAARKGG